MIKVITAALMRIIKMLIGSRLLGLIKLFVEDEMKTDKSGAEKKAAVDKALKNLGGDVKSLVTDTSGYLINLGIEGAVAYFMARK